jgi:DNA-binding NarL/FixJ family response regulator
MNLVIVEDSALVRDQLLRLVGTEPSIRIVGQAISCDSATELILKEKPDAVLLDLSLHESSGIDVLARIRAAGNRARVLVLTNNACDAMRRACEMHEISGFYDKTLETSACIAKLFSWIPPRAH